MSAEPNPFEAPGTDPLVSDMEQSLDREFVSISISRLIILEIASFGLYHLVWFYRNFRKAHSTGSAVFRTLFAGLACFELFRSMEMSAVEHEVKPVVPALAAGVMVLVFGVATYFAPDRYAMLSPFVSAIPLALMQATVNATQQKRGVRGTDHIGAGTIIVVVLGVTVWALNIAGLFMVTPEG